MRTTYYHFIDSTVGIGTTYHTLATGTINEFGIGISSHIGIGTLPRAGADLAMHHDGSESKRTGGLEFNANSDSAGDKHGARILSYNRLFSDKGYRRLRFQASEYQFETPTDGTSKNNAGPTVNITGFGSVGIGTTDPLAQLDIRGDARFNNKIYDKDGDSGTSGQVLSSTGTQVDWVNVGTLSAGAASQVAVTASNDNSNFNITFVDSTSGNQSIKVDTNSNFIYNPSINRLELNTFSGTGFMLSGSGSEYVGMQLKTSDSSATVSRNIFIDTVNELGNAVANQVGSVQSDGGSHWRWETQPSGDRTDRRVERLRITASGNVGIGITDPVAKLDVAGKILAGDSVTHANLSNTLDTSVNAGETAFRPINLIDTSSIIKLARVHDDFGPGLDLLSWNANLTTLRGRALISIENGDLKIMMRDGSSTVEKLRITSDGKVGIGTTNPTQILHLSSNSNQTSIRLSNVGTGGTDWYVQSSGNDASNGQGNFSIYNGAINDYALSITAEGNVGIGTTNPTGTDALAGNTATLAVGILTANTIYGNVVGVSTASQVNFVPSGTGAVTRTVDSKLGDVVSVKDFGATGDGTTDDTAAIQAALNSAASVFFPNAKYRITSTLSQTVLNQKLYGNISRGNDLDAKIFLDSSSSSNGVINVRAPGTTIESLVLEGKGSTVANSYVIDANEEGFDSANNGNVDLTLINCNITDAKTLVKITGRGLQADSSSFVSFTNAIELDWPSNFVAGSNPDQKLKTGMRAYGIRGCRFHGGSSNFALKNVGSNAANIHGLQFTDNYIDTNTAIFKGHLHDSLFSNNVIIHSYPSAYFLFDIEGGSNFQINNNVFYGMDDNGAGTEENLLGIVALTNCVGCQIDNNTINRVERDVVSTSGTCSNISVSGNTMKNICLSNDGGTTRSPVRVNAAIDKLMVKNNIIDLTEITPSSWNKSEIIKNTGGYAITDHDVRGNMFDPTYWNLHNFLDASTVGISTSDRNIERYDGDGTTSKTFTYAFKPLAVMAFNTNTLESLMVSCFDSAGASSVDISGYNVIVKSNFNTNGQKYYLYVFQ